MPITIAGPQTHDHKIIVTQFPASEGWHTWFTSRGDQLSPPIRGAGTPIFLRWTTEEARGEKTAALQFIEPVEVHDGEAMYLGDWTADDSLNFSVSMPATPLTANGSGTGNANKYPIGEGINAIIPAMGNGAWDLNLADAVPIPAKTSLGYWDCVYTTGAVTPSSTPGSASYMLLDFSPPEVYFVRNLLLGSPLGVWDIDTYKVEWLHPKWLLNLKVNKQSPGAGDFSGWLLFYRQQTT